MKNNLTNLFIYVGSLLLPWLVLFPQLFQFIKISGWGIAGCIVAMAVSIIVLLITLKRPIKIIIIFIALTVILIIILTFANKVPKYTVPISFFICYYAIDFIAIIISLLYGVYSNKHTNKDQ